MFYIFLYMPALIGSIISYHLVQASMANMPHISGTNVANMPHISGTSVANMSHISGTGVASKPQQSGTSVGSMPQQSGTSVASIPQPSDLTTKLILKLKRGIKGVKMCDNISGLSSFGCQTFYITV